MKASASIGPSFTLVPPHNIRPDVSPCSDGGEGRRSNRSGI
jgi:hypothetical protein